jgi:uncharacterized protein with GYD domain
MPQYVALLNGTDQGVRAVADTPNRGEQGRRLVERLGGRLTAYLWTLGRFDAVVLFEAPDDETASAIMLAAGAQGFFRSETLRAFTAEERQSILGKL